MVDGPTSALWAQLRTMRPASDGALSTIPICSDGVDTPLFMGTDSAGDLHLLIPVERGPVSPKPPDLNGLRIRHHRLETGEYLDLIANPSHEKVFNPVCEEVVRAVLVEQREPWSAVAAIIRAWQSAWRPTRQEMDKTAQVGLFGELLVLQNLMIPCLGPSGVDHWSGPEAERHDFTTARLHLEVKTTRKSRHEHEISRLDQLRVPDGCKLLLVSIQLEQSVGGAESLATLIDTIINLIRSDGAATDTFMTKLVNLGWSEDMRDSGELLLFHVRDASVYVVDEDFPRLPDDFTPPSGVVSVRYTVDLANLPALGLDEVTAIIKAENPSCVT